MERNREPRTQPRSLGKQIGLYGLYAQLIFDKGGRNIKWSKYLFFNKCYWEICIATCKKMKLDHQLIPYTKISSRWIKDLNISQDSTKVLYENISRKISDIPYSNIFTDMSQGKGYKEKNKQMGLHQIINLIHSKRKHQQNENGANCVGKHMLPMISQTGI